MLVPRVVVAKEQFAQICSLIAISILEQNDYRTFIWAIISRCSTGSDSFNLYVNYQEWHSLFV